MPAVVLEEAGLVTYTFRWASPPEPHASLDEDVIVFLSNDRVRRYFDNRQRKVSVLPKRAKYGGRKGRRAARRLRALLDVWSRWRFEGSRS